MANGYSLLRRPPYGNELANSCLPRYFDAWLSTWLENIGLRFDSVCTVDTLCKLE